MELLTTSSTWPSKAPKTARRSEWLQYITLDIGEKPVYKSILESSLVCEVE